MVGLAVLGIPIVRILFQRGAFALEATLYTAQALFWFALGLWAVAGVRIVVNVFYSLQDIVTPVKVAIVSIVCNLILSLLLMKPMQHAGLALAVSLSSALNLFILLAILRVRLGQLGLTKLIGSTGKTLCSSAAMGVVVYLIYQAAFWDRLTLPLHEVVTLLASISSGIFVYFLCSYILKSSELLSLWASIRKGKSP